MNNFMNGRVTVYEYLPEIHYKCVKLGSMDHSICKDCLLFSAGQVRHV